MVDDLELAQFIYLISTNEKIKNAIDTITSKAVLILGRFTEERHSVLTAIRERLRSAGLAPILFDFEKPRSKDTRGMVETVARMARFIIADLTGPRSFPHELDDRALPSDDSGAAVAARRFERILNVPGPGSV